MAKQGTDRRFFDAWSLGYDFTIPQRLAYRPVHDAVVELLAPRDRAMRLLDIGCGTGELAGRIRKAFPRAHVTGCDFSTGMLRRAVTKDHCPHWVQGDACRLPFRAGSFDVIVSTEAFHWFPDQQQALREFHRVLARRGRLLLALVSPPLSALSALARIGGDLLGTPFYWPTRTELARRLEATGFAVESQRRLFRFPGLLLLPVLTEAVRRET